MSFQQLLDTLPKLSQQQLRELKTRIDFFLEPVEEYSSEQAFFYTVINKQLASLTNSPIIPFASFKKRQKYGKFREAFVFISSYGGYILPNNSKQIKIQFYMLFVKIMTNYLTRNNLPLDFNVLMNVYDKFPPQLEEAFPGYLFENIISVVFS